MGTPSAVELIHRYLAVRRPKAHQPNRHSQPFKQNNKPTPPKWFSPLTFSTLRLRLRPASTSSRPSCPLPDHSSWTSSALAASPSPPSTLTPRPSSFAPAAQLSSASPLVARPVSPRAALSGESRCNDE